MMTQEEYVDIPRLKRQGWTLEQIAKEVGYHPATVREWIRRGGPPPQRRVDPSNLVISERWAKEVAKLLEANPNLLGTSVERLLRAQGYAGSYPTLARYLREVRGPRKVARWRSRSRSRPPPVRSSSSTGRTAVTSHGSRDGMSCTASGPSCATAGAGTGGSPTRSTAPTPSRD